jgi:hypothetical protein
MVPLIQYLAVPVELVFWSIDKGTPAPVRSQSCASTS